MNPDEMTPQEINVAIAELCGWTDIYKQSDGMLCGITPPDKSGIKWDSRVPYYYYSLDAMAQAEATLTGIELVKWQREVCNICWSDGEDGDDIINQIRATPAQRARAFLRAKGWKKDNL